MKHLYNSTNYMNSPNLRNGGKNGKTIVNCYRSDTVNSKSFVGKVFLGIKGKVELTVNFKHEMIEKHFPEMSQKL